MPRSEIEGKDNSSEDKSNYKVVCRGDMVYNSMRMWQGANGISDYDGIVSPAYTVLMSTEEIDNQYFAALFKTSNLINEFRKNSQGLTSDTWNLKYPQIRAIRLYIPSLQEQRKISTFIGTLEERIRKQRQLVDSLKKYKRGLNHALLFEIDGQYNQELGTVCSIEGGGTPDTLRPKYWEGNVEWFTPSEIGKSKYVLSSLRKISQIGLSNSSAKLLPAGTVLLTTRATLGEMSIARSECSTNQGFQSLIADSKRVLPEYLYYLQILIKPWCEKYASGNTFREISKASLSKCVVPVPCLNSQKRIVCILSRIDDLIETHKRVKDSLTQIKESLLQQLFI